MLRQVSPQLSSVDNPRRLLHIPAQGEPNFPLKGLIASPALARRKYVYEAGLLPRPFFELFHYHAEYLLVLLQDVVVGHAGDVIADHSCRSIVGLRPVAGR